MNTSNTDLLNSGAINTLNFSLDAFTDLAPTLQSSATNLLSISSLIALEDVFSTSSENVVQSQLSPLSSSLVNTVTTALSIGPKSLSSLASDLSNRESDASKVLKALNINIEELEKVASISADPELAKKRFIESKLEQLCQEKIKSITENIISIDAWMIHASEVPARSASPVEVDSSSTSTAVPDRFSPENTPFLGQRTALIGDSSQILSKNLTFDTIVLPAADLAFFTNRDCRLYCSEELTLSLKKTLKIENSTTALIIPKSLYDKQSVKDPVIEEVFSTFRSGVSETVQQGIYRQATLQMVHVFRTPSNDNVILRGADRVYGNQTRRRSILLSATRRIPNLVLTQEDQQVLVLDARDTVTESTLVVEQKQSDELFEKVLKALKIRGEVRKYLQTQQMPPMQQIGGGTQNQTSHQVNQAKYNEQRMKVYLLILIFSRTPDMELTNNTSLREEGIKKLSHFSVAELMLIQQKQSYILAEIKSINTSSNRESSVIEHVRYQSELLETTHFLAHKATKIKDIKSFLLLCATKGYKFPNITEWALPFNQLDHVGNWFGKDGLSGRLEEIQKNLQESRNFLSFKVGVELSPDIFNKVNHTLSKLIESASFFREVKKIVGKSAPNPSLFALAKDHSLFSRFASFLAYFQGGSVINARRFLKQDTSLASYTTEMPNSIKTAGSKLSVPLQINVHKDAIEHISDMLHGCLLDPVFIGASIHIPVLCGQDVYNNDYLRASIYNNIEAISRMRDFIKPFNIPVKFLEMTFFEFTLLLFTTREVLDKQFKLGLYDRDQIEYAVIQFAQYKHRVLFLFSAYCDFDTFNKVKNLINEEWEVFLEPLKNCAFYDSILKDYDEIPSNFEEIETLFSWPELKRIHSTFKAVKEEALEKGQNIKEIFGITLESLEKLSSCYEDLMKLEADVLSEMNFDQKRGQIKTILKMAKETNESLRLSFSGFNNESQTDLSALKNYNLELYQYFDKFDLLPKSIIQIFQNLRQEYRSNRFNLNLEPSLFPEDKALERVNSGYIKDLCMKAETMSLSEQT